MPPPARHAAKPVPGPPPPLVAPWRPEELDRFAPAPRLRVGLSTSAEAVRLTSARPFRLGTSRGGILETQDVLIEPGLPAAALEGAVFRIQAGSFPTRAQAAAFRSRLLDEERLGDDVVLRRERGSGRFAVRLGAFSTEDGARARLAELRPLGLEAVSVVREPVSRPRPQELVLRAPGRPVVHVPELSLYAMPGAPGAFIEVDGRAYRGAMALFVNRSNLVTIVNVVNLEDYLKGVVPAELSPKAFPEKEAIKAQALAARTYAEKRRGQFEAEGYDICATPACQVYRGVAVEQPMATEAVIETAGEVLTYEGELVDALYTSTCGGRTENAENVFSSPKPYLVSRACFLESGNGVASVSSTAEPTSLEGAVLEVLGLMSGTEPGNDPVSTHEARRVMADAVRYLGQTPCFGAEPPPGRALELRELASLLGAGLCWDRRLLVLLSAFDAERLVPLPGLADGERRSLGYAVQEGLVTLPEDGTDPKAVVSRRVLAETIYRLLRARGKPPLAEGRVLRVAGNGLVLRDESLGDENNTIQASFAPSLALFRAQDEGSFYVPRLTLLAGDRVSYHLGDGGIDVLSLRTEGGSFDRSSKFSHWVVRKSNADLSRELDARYGIGELLDLRPKRYGKSGRIVELEILGTEHSGDVTGLAVRRALGVRENLFFLDAQRSAGGDVEAWVFTGRGWGHGVGMCQVGAFGMAAAGYSYRQILAHYYPGTAVARAPSTTGVVDVDMALHAP